MHDIKFIRDNPEEFANAMKLRGLSSISKYILVRSADRRMAITDMQTLLEAKNKASKVVEKAKNDGKLKKFEETRAIIKQVKIDIADADEIGKKIIKDFQNLLMRLPNIPMGDVPKGKDESQNVELHKIGEPRNFNFEALEHFNIPAVSKGMDFETAAKLSGSRFVLLSGAVARVHRALAQFMLDLHINEHELMEINPPVIVNTATMEGTGQLPKFAHDSYKIQKKRTKINTVGDQWLIPTSEVPLTNIVADKILNKNQLPLRYCAHSLCFRREAGSAGRDTAGILRQHQFEKVEMVSITHPDESREELDIMTTKAEAVLKKLGLAFRTVVLCTGDMGFSAQRTHDIEVWLPGQNRYREISSVSVCGDFQARRMNARFREKDGDKPQFVHTLNGSGVAVGRCLIAVLENGQQADGSVKLPKVLHPYLGGKDTINPDGILEKAT